MLVSPLQAVSHRDSAASDHTNMQVHLPTCAACRASLTGKLQMYTMIIIL
jgi:hypothetical protein